MSEEIKDPKEIFKNFDTEKSEYIINDKRFKVKEVTIEEYEYLQDQEAEMQDLQGKETTAKEALELERNWNKLVLETAFGKDVDIQEIKNACKTVNKYNTIIAEVLVFLVRFSGMDGLQEFITLSTIKKDQQEKTKD